MKRGGTAKTAEHELRGSGFATVLASNMHTFADIFAQGREGKYIIKAVHNIDSVTRKEAVALSKLSQFMGAEPLVVGEVSKNNKLKLGVSYYRFSIRCVSPEMLSNLSDSATSPLASKSVGLKAMVDGTKLRRLRKMSGSNAPDLARRAKISISTLYKHERSSNYAAMTTVTRLEKILGDSVRTESQQYYRRTVFKTGTLEGTGMQALKLNTAPFDIVAKDKNLFEISLDANSRTLAKRATFFSAIRETFENNYPFFLSSRKKGRVLGVPVVGKEEISRVHSEDDLLDLVY
jgi:putative transcriptional regulator